MSFRAPLDALARAGVPFEFRKGIASLDELPAEGEVDLWLEPEDMPAASAAIRSAGFVAIDTPRGGAHRFFVEMQGGRWRKLDVKLRGHPDRMPRSGLGTVVAAARARRPLGWRRAGPIVAMVGPDGAGKGTLIALVAGRIPLAVTTVYLGGRRGSHSTEGATYAGPATDANPTRARAVRESAFVLRKAFRGWWRLARGYAAAWRGHVVLCDRHPLEVLAVRPDRSSVAGAFERFLAAGLTPEPDAIVVLDAPAEVLFERKPEHPTGTLDSWRRAYRETFAPRGATFVDTAGPVEAAAARVSEVVWTALRSRRGA